MPGQTSYSYLNRVQPIDRTLADELLRQTPLYGRKMVILGDSYVRNHQRPIEESYHYKVARKYGMAYLNYGVNGNCIAFDRTERGFGIRMTDRMDELEAPADYVLAAGGHNDVTMINQREPGESEEEHAVLESGRKMIFERHLRILAERLLDKYPKARIALITPWEIERENFPYMLSLLRKTAEEYGLGLFEAGREGHIDPNSPEFRARYFQGPEDTAHLNSMGHDLLVPAFEKFLLSL